MPIGTAQRNTDTVPLTCVRHIGQLAPLPKPPEQSEDTTSTLRSQVSHLS